MDIGIAEKRKNIDILKSKDTYLLGVLATDLEVYPNLGESQEAVSVMKNRNFYNENSNILFYIKPISEETDYIKYKITPKCNSGELYVGIDKHQKSADIYPFTSKDQSYYNLLSNEEKKEEILNALEDKLILFKPNIFYDESTDKVYKNLKIQQVFDHYKKDIYYRAIPKVNISNNVFEDKLRKGEYIYLENYNTNMLYPEFIICGEYIYSHFESWKKHEGNYKLWSCDKGHNEIRKTKVIFSDKDYIYDIIEALDYLIFISDSLFEKIYSLTEEGEILFKDTICNNIEIEKIDQNIRANETNFVDIDFSLTGISCEDNSDSISSFFKSASSENNFLKNFKNYTIQQNLCYDMKDLVNFHISVKTNALTILAGMSGNGKTQIAKAYAETLGINKKNNTLLFLPINPSYTQPEDLIGYLNNTTGLYVASETGLVDFLIHAENNREKMHMVIFDEMNLSQVEYWFAPFISLLEINQNERNLQLYSEGATCHNNTKYKNYVNIGDNIIFVGTVNLDETTKDFSDRLLDRANLVTLNKKKFKDFRDEKIKSYYNISDIERNIYSYDDYSSWVDDVNGVDSFSSEELIFLDELHEIIQEYDDQKGVSFRILEKISKYINNIPQIFDENENDIISRRDAFDIEIKQRVLTKIKGSERKFGELVGRYDTISKTIINSRLYDFLSSDSALKVSDFTLSKQDVVRKSKELTLYGYTN